MEIICKEGYPALYEGSTLIGKVSNGNMVYKKEELDKIKPLRYWLGFQNEQEEYISDIKTFYARFVLRRYGTSPRNNEKDYLESIGYTKTPINKLEVIVMTNAKNPCDTLWVDFGDGEIYNKQWT